MVWIISKLKKKEREQKTAYGFEKIISILEAWARRQNCARRLVGQKKCYHMKHPPRGNIGRTYNQPERDCG